MKKSLLNIGIVLLLCFSSYQYNWHVRDRIYEIRYDWTHDNQEVIFDNQIDAIFAQMEVIDFNLLDNSYLENTKSKQPKYQKLLQDLTYYKIKRSDLNKRIAGSFRLKEFLAKDAYLKNCILNKKEYLVAPLNPQIFYKTIALQETLDQQGYDCYAFHIMSGHRHPKYNERIGGAGLSRHMKGEAIDIKIGDINMDGQANKADKDIVLKILDEEIIKDKGGIGLYPGTGNIHYDVRGSKARWNSF